MHISSEHASTCTCAHNGSGFYTGVGLSGPMDKYKLFRIGELVHCLGGLSSSTLAHLTDTEGRRVGGCMDGETGVGGGPSASDRSRVKVVNS